MQERIIDNSNKVLSGRYHNLVVGVFGGNELNSFFIDDTIYTQIDLNYEECMRELVNQGKSEDEIDQASDEYCSDGATYLIGDWKQDKDDKYIFDKNGALGFAGIYDSNMNIYTIEWSKYSIRCAPTSPCYRMYDGRPCGDISTKGTLHAYCVPGDYLTKNY